MTKNTMNEKYETFRKLCVKLSEKTGFNFMTLWQTKVKGHEGIKFVEAILVGNKIHIAIVWANNQGFELYDVNPVMNIESLAENIFSVQS